MQIEFIVFKKYTSVPNHRLIQLNQLENPDYVNTLIDEVHTLSIYQKEYPY